MSRSVGYVAILWMPAVLCALSLMIALVLEVPEVQLGEERRAAAQTAAVQSAPLARETPCERHPGGGPIVTLLGPRPGDLR